MRALTTADLDAIPRLGWVREPTPITSLPRTAEAVGLAFLGVKRDDLLEPLHGGTKPRKLDYVLAASPFAEAPLWASSGGIGSGSLVALTAAAQKLGRRLRAHMFWTPISEGVTDNLAFTAGGPTSILYYRGRTTMALRRPGVVLGGRDGDVPVIPPGATSPLGMMGTVRAGLELAEQIHGGAVPEPDRIYVALGSGGTAIGLAIGLSLGGIRTPVTAVAVVEHLLSAGPRLASLTRDALAELARWGVVAPPGDLPLLVDRDHLGSAYAHPTPASLAACVTLAAEGIDLEPVYTGKAMAAVIADARRLGLRNVLFWSTVRRALPEPAAGWRDKLPPALHRRLDAPPPGRVTRRRVLAGLAAAAAVGVGVRLTGYDDLPGFPGEVLSAWHARVILAAAEALLPPDTDPDVLERIPARLDRYLVGMPPKVKREVKAMLGVIEHGTTPLGHTLHRFTLLAAVERERYLAGLAARGDLYAQVYNGIRDLVMLGCYQQPATWKALGYEGPKLPLDYDPRGPARPAWPVYDALVAPAGLTPKGLLP